MVALFTGMVHADFFFAGLDSGFFSAFFSAGLPLGASFFDCSACLTAVAAFDCASAWAATAPAAAPGAVSAPVAADATPTPSIAEAPRPAARTATRVRSWGEARLRFVARFDIRGGPP